MIRRIYISSCYTFLILWPRYRIRNQWTFQGSNNYLMIFQAYLLFHKCPDTYEQGPASQKIARPSPGPFACLYTRVSSYLSLFSVCLSVFRCRPFLARTRTVGKDSGPESNLVSIDRPTAVWNLRKSRSWTPFTNSPKWRTYSLHDRREILWDLREGSIATMEIRINLLTNHFCKDTNFSATLKIYYHQCCYSMESIFRWSIIET